MCFSCAGLKPIQIEAKQFKHMLHTCPKSVNAFGITRQCHLWCMWQWLKMHLQPFENPDRRILIIHPQLISKTWALIWCNLVLVRCVPGLGQKVAQWITLDNLPSRALGLFPIWGHPCCWQPFCINAVHCVAFEWGHSSSNPVSLFSPFLNGSPCHSISLPPPAHRSLCRLHPHSGQWSLWYLHITMAPAILQLSWVISVWLHILSSQAFYFYSGAILGVQKL